MEIRETSKKGKEEQRKGNKLKKKIKRKARSQKHLFKQQLVQRLKMIKMKKMKPRLLSLMLELKNYLMVSKFMMTEKSKKKSKMKLKKQ